MKRSQAFASNYLGKDDVPDAVTAIIADVVVKPVKCEHGDENKPVMTFAHNQFKPLIMNNINWETLEDAYGDDSDLWRGQPVEIYVDPNVMYGKRRVGGIRLRAPAVVRLTNGSAPSSSPPAVAIAPPSPRVNPKTAADVALAIGGMSAAGSPERLEEWIAWYRGIADMSVQQEAQLDSAARDAKARLTRHIPGAPPARRQAATG